MYEEGVDKILNRKKTQENEEILSENCTFQPNLNKNNNVYLKEEQNFEERVIATLKKKQESLLKIEAEKSEKFTFRPKINKKSEEIILAAKNASKIQDSHNNSFTFQGKSASGKETKYSIYDENHCTFQPKILENQKYEVKGDFLSRMEEKNKEKQIKIREKQQENLVSKPKINKNSEKLARNKKEKDFSAKKEEILHEYEEKFNEMHSFQPKLSKKPKNFQYNPNNLFDNSEKKAKKLQKKQVF